MTVQLAVLLGVGGLGFAGLLLALLLQGRYRQGRADEEIDAQARKDDFVLQASRHRDRAVRDGDYARRLRDRYTR